MRVQVSVLYALTYIASMFFPALSAVFKERIFSDAKEKLGGKDLDLFAVNSFGSAAQAGCVFLLLPVISSLRGISFTDLPQYITAGNSLSDTTPCSYSSESAARVVAIDSSQTNSMSCMNDSIFFMPEASCLLDVDLDPGKMYLFNA